MYRYHDLAQLLGLPLVYICDNCFLSLSLSNTPLDYAIMFVPWPKIEVQVCKKQVNQRRLESSLWQPDDARPPRDQCETPDDAGEYSPPKSSLVSAG